MRGLFTFMLSLSLAFAVLVVFRVQAASRTALNLENNGIELPAQKAQNNLVAANSLTVRMVVVPSGDAQQTARAVEQLGTLLEQETGRTVYTFVYSCYGAAVDAMVLNEADIGWLPAATYVLAHDGFGVNVKLVTERLGTTSFRGQFVVRNDSGINNLGNLAGKNFAFVAPLSTSGFLYPALHISNTQGITYDAYFNQTVFAGSHNAVVEAVYNGQSGSLPIDGGATFEDARGNVVGDYPDVFNETKVVAYTDFIPNDTVSVRPGLEPIVTQQVISGLLSLADTPGGSDALQQLLGIEGLQPTDDSTYDIVRQAVAAFGLEFETCSEVADATNSSGGSLTYVDGLGLTTTIQIPPGTVTDTVQIRYTSLPAITYRPVGLDEIGRAFDLKAVISGTNQTVSSALSPYTTIVGYSQSALGSIAENTLALYGWDGANWQREPTSMVNPTANTVSASPDHFSFFVVLGARQVYLPIVIKN